MATAPAAGPDFDPVIAEQQLDLLTERHRRF